MFTIKRKTPFDAMLRETLLNDVLGEARFAKTSARLREDRLPAEGLSFAARTRRRVVGSVELSIRLCATTEGVVVARCRR